MAVLELDENFNQVDSKVLNFSSDLSGIFYEENEDVYWIISHESKLIGKFDKYFNLLKSYPVPLEQGEGVAIDYEINSSTLYQMKIMDFMCTGGNKPYITCF